MPTITDPKELALAIEDAGSLMLRWGHNQLRHLPAEEIAMIVAALRRPVTEARENEWLEDELMEVMRIVAKGMNPDLPEEDEIIYAMMVTAIRRLMEADTDKYEALLERWQKRHASVSPQQEKSNG